MKIAVNGKSLARTDPGGAVRVGLSITSHLATLVDWEFDVWLPDNGAAGVLPEMPANVRICFQPGYQFRSAMARFWWEQWHLPRLLNAGDYDLVLNLTNSAAVLRRIRAPQVLLVHDSGFLSKGWFTRAFSAYLGLLIRLANRRKCQIVTVSQTSAIQLRQAFPSMDHVVVIPNGIDPAPAEITPYQPGYPYLLFLGSRNPRKNLQGMMEAFQAFRSGRPDDLHHLVIVGGGNDIFRDVDTSREDSHIQWLGYVDDEEKWSVLAGAGGLLLPSFLEGFGLPVGEALSIGIPVMASDIPVFHEIYGEAIDVYVDPHDTGSMAEGIERLLENQAQFASAGRSTKEWLSRYQWSAVAAQYRDLCLDLIGKRPS